MAPTKGTGDELHILYVTCNVPNYYYEDEDEEDKEIVRKQIKVAKIESSIPQKLRKTGINLSKFPGSFANRRR